MCPLSRLILYLVPQALIAQNQPVDVLMSQYNPERTNANTAERILRPTNVNSSLFGKIGEYQVDHVVYALPLVVNNVGGRNLLIVATMANTVYAFDLSRPASDPPVWQRRLGTPGVGTTSAGLAPAPTPQQWGILSTPFVDRSTNTLYAVAKVLGSGGNDTLEVNALDLATGNPKFNSPQTMTFPAAGAGTLTAGVGFTQRAGLLVQNGVLYVAVANVRIVPAEDLSQEGFVQSFDASNLSVRYASFQVTPSGLKGGIWQAGRGLSADEQGFVYVATAGGSYNGLDNFGSSILRLSPQTLNLVDWFTPQNHATLFSSNLDISANGVTLIPGTTLAFGGGKEGVVYLLNRNHMGRLETASNGPLQRFQASEGCRLVDCAQTLGTAFWARTNSPESMLFVWDRRDFLRMFTFNNATLRFIPQVAAIGPLRIEQTGGPTVSSLDEDLGSGVVWAVTVPTAANETLTEATLRAYSAANIGQELYNSDQNRARDALGFFTKFAPPVVANGRVFVPTHSNKVVAYGLLNPRTLTVTVTGSGTVSGTPGGLRCFGPNTCTATFDEQATVQLTGQPLFGAAFTGWSGGGCSGTGPCTVAMSASRSVTATFAAGAPLTVTKTGSGTVTGNGIDCGTLCNLNLPVGTAVSLTATPALGSQFQSWTEGPCAGSTNAICSFVLSTATTVTAGFTNMQSQPQGQYFLPISPCRAVDTRTTTAIPGMTFRDIGFAACNIPSNATAVALNVTVVPQGLLGYLTIWPAGQEQPLVSTLNSLDGRVKANAAIVGVGTNRAVSVFVTNTAHVVLDVAGYFVPPNTAGALAYYPVSPCRALDTRTPSGGGIFAPGETRRITIAQSGGCLPAEAQAYAANMTVVPSEPLGYLTLWPDGVVQPTVSTLNALTGTVVANAAIVQAGSSGALRAFLTNRAHLVMDLNGYFAPPGGAGAMSFYPVQPCRVADTRIANGPSGPMMAADSARDFVIPATPCGIPRNARAFVLNATVVPPALFGFLTLWPGGTVPRPTVSTLNAVDAALTSNMAIVPASPSGLMRAFTSNSTHLILDISGYFAP